MEEEDILILEQLGYTVNEVGAITNKEGGYVSKVNHNGRDIESFASEKENFNHIQREKKLSEIKFEYDSSKGGSLENQKSVALAKDQLKNLEKNPLRTKIPHVQEDPIYAQAFGEIMGEKKNNGDFVFDTPEDFVASSQEGTIYEDFEDVDSSNDLKEVESRIAEIESIDPDYDKQVENRKAQLEEQIEKEGLFTTRSFGQGLKDNFTELASMFTSTGAGMKDKDRQKEYLDLLEKRKDLLRIPIENKVTEIEDKIEDYSNKIETVEGRDRDMLIEAVNKLEVERDNLTDYIEGNSIPSKFFTTDNAIDIGSAGFSDVMNQLKFDLAINKKLEAGEPLTESETALFTQRAISDEIAKKQYIQNKTYNFLDGLHGSLKFLLGGAIGRNVGSGVSKKVAKKVSEKTGKQLATKIADVSTNILTQAALHSDSSDLALERYNGEVEIREDKSGELEILSGKRLYNTIKSENELKRQDLISAITDAEKAGEQDKVDALKAELKEFNKFDSRIVEPENLGGSIAYGFTESFKEAASEMVGGRIYKAIGGKRIDAALSKSKLGEAILGKRGSSFANKIIGGDPSDKLIGSTTEEMFEEILVQATPTYGQDLEQYLEQASEITKKDFLLNVAAQTIVMNQGFRGARNASNVFKAQFMSKEDKQARKNMSDLYKQMGKRDITQDKFNEILIKSGKGNLTGQEYKNAIETAKKEGRISEANTMEQEMFVKQAMSSQKVGKLDQYVNMLSRLKYNENISPETLANAEVAKAFINEMQEDQVSYINHQEVTNLKKLIRNNESTSQDLMGTNAQKDLTIATQEFEKIKEKLEVVDASFENFSKNAKITEYIENNYDKLSSELQNHLAVSHQQNEINANIKTLKEKLNRVTSFDHQTKLEKERDYLRYLELINKRAFKGNMSSTQFKNVLSKIPANKQKGITKARLQELHETIQGGLQNVDYNKKVKAEKISEEKNKEKAVNTQPTPPVQKDLKAEAPTSEGSILEGVDQNLEPSEDEKNYPKLSEEAITALAGMKLMEEESTDLGDDLPVQSMAPAFQEWANIYRTQKDKEPIFNDFLESAFEGLDGNVKAFSKQDLQNMGDTWEAAGLGKSNWEAAYTKYFTDMNQFAAKVISSFPESFSEEKVENSTPNSIESNTAIKVEESVAEVSAQKEIQKLEPAVGVNPLTGEPFKVTPVSGKTSVLSPKANFAALEYQEENEVVMINGKKSIRYKKKASREIPTLNTGGFVNIKNTLHPEKNNPGDKWDVQVTNESEWGEDDLLVSVHTSTGEVAKRISFAEWLSINQPKDMSLAEFQKTDAFISKVPMYYTDSEGEVVGIVGDTDWYNAVNVRDTSKTGDDYVVLDHLSESHKSDIQKGKDNALQLRKSIIKGEINQMEIVSKGGSPLINIPTYDKNNNLIPLKKLSDIAPDTKLAMFVGSSFVDTDGVPLDLNKIEIVNLEGIKSKAKQQKGRLNSAYYLSPINKTDKKQRFIALDVQRRDEDNKLRATKEDIKTTKILLKAHATLNNGVDGQGMSLNIAKNIKQQVMDITGLDITDGYNQLGKILNSLIMLQPKSGGKIHVLDAKKKPGTEDISETFSTDYTPVQNTNIDPTNRHAIKIDYKEGEYFVEKLGETYDDYLKTRFSTNIMSYNMGTTENPVTTVSVQPIIKLKPIEYKSETKKVEAIVTPNADPSLVIKEANDFLNSINGLDITENFGEDLPSLDTTENLNVGLGVIDGFTLSQQNDIANFIVGKVIAKTSIGESLEFPEFRKKMEPIFKSHFNDIKSKLSQYETTLNNSLENNPDNQELVNTLSKVRVNLDKVNSALEKVEEFSLKSFEKAQKNGVVATTIKTEEELKEDFADHMEEEMYDKDFSKSSNEIIHKDKLGTKVKRLLAGVSNQDKGFMGVDRYETQDNMYNVLLSLLVSPAPTAPTIDSMVQRLEANKDAYPWLPEFIQVLKEAGQDVQNSFVTNLYKFPLRSKLVLHEKGKDGQRETKVLESNANSLTRKIRRAWENAFLRGDITKGDEINTEKLTSLYSQWESWGEDKHTQSDQVLRTWLKDFGISLSDKAWADLKEGKLITGTGRKQKPTSFEELFQGKEKRGGLLFTNLAAYAKQNKGKNKLDFIENPSNHPYKDMGNVLKSLVSLEAKYNREQTSIAMRDGGKTISGMVLPTHFLNTVNKLKESAQGDKSYVQALRKISFSKNSLLLDLLDTDPNFAHILEYGEPGQVSLKEKSAATPFNGKVDNLSEIGYMFHQRALFQNLDKDKFTTIKYGLPLRIAEMSTPTNSDKGRMMTLNTAVFNLYGTPSALEKHGDVFKFSDSVKEMLFEQIISPELQRALNFKSTDIKNYEKGARRFNLIPELNLITDKNGVTALEALETVSTVAEFKERFKEGMLESLEVSINAEAKSYATKVESYMTNNSDSFNNKEYLAQIKEGTVQDRILRAEIDYVINSLVSNVNTLQAIAGDPAIFYKSGANPKSLDIDSQNKASKDLGTNLGKRLAMMIAPGRVLSDAKNETYLQVFLEDSAEVAQDIENIVKWHYGSEKLNKEFKDKTYKEHLKDLRNGTASKEVSDRLKSEFDAVADFMEIESTDAQEYTTLKEHLRVLRGDGKITSEQESEIIDTVYNKKERLGEKDRNLVLQPIKPVYAGNVLQEDVNRIMYIKSSSFPLIPDLVRGTKLEPLMKKLEELETKHKKFVRASYQSANKVGAMKNAINPFDSASLEQLDILQNKDGQVNPAHALELDRMNFRIQQDVPYKSAKKKDDQVSMGTQIFKLLMGDGVKSMKGFEYKGEKLNGKQLQDRFFESYSKIVNSKKEGLLSDLGLDEEFKAEDELEAAKRLQFLLKSEAKSRGFSDADIKGLSISQRVIDGKPVYHFKQPLWFSGNSNKYESMFNALINNAIFKQKMPGNAFVVGSEAGMKHSTDSSSIPNDVIKVGDYTGGELKNNEVLLPSKFKMNKEIIDLFKKKDGEYVYINQTESGFSLKEDMIDPSLLENFVFRTPTSSHGSGAKIKIAGFLPTIQGDLMITTKKFVTQMGQDFDIDKLTSYAYHHTIGEGGKIEKLNLEHKAKVISRIESQLKNNNKGAEELSFLNGIIGEELKKEFKSESLSLEAKIDMVSRQYDLKLAQNDFIEIHHSVYNNPSAEIQKKINKALTMEIAEQQADAIEELNGKNDNSTFNILSPGYQMRKMLSGSVGAAAIGIYAKGVTFNSLSQQVDKKVYLGKNGTEDKKQIQIGKILSSGQLGLNNTLSKEDANSFEASLSRSLAQTLDEKVNTATDNEKAQILGRVGLTDLSAVAVDNLLTMLGIDLEINELKKADFDSSNPFHKTKLVEGKEKYYSQYSLPYLLHSQPIVKEYFKRVKDLEAGIDTIEGFAKTKVMDDLIGKTEINPNFHKRFTGENLVNQIQNGNIKSDMQKQILALYLDLMEDAKNLKDFQEVVDMSNLGKSMWAAKDKIEKFKNLFDNSPFINAKELLGEFGPKATSIKIEEGQYFDPTTNQGVMVGNAISLSRNLFFKYFPYYDNNISSKIEKIASDAVGKGGEVSFKEFVFQEMKKFVVSTKKLNLFDNDPVAERERLLLNKNGNKSLSSYLADITQGEVNSKGLKYLKTNPLISFMEFEKGRNGEPDFIYFDNSQLATMEEDQFYTAFKELFIKNIALPNKNGEPFSTRELAQELVAYSYLTGGIVSGARQFHKYIPIEYYDDLIEKSTGKKTISLIQNLDTMLVNWEEAGVLDRFEHQFFQNFPQYVSSLPQEIELTKKDNSIELHIKEDYIKDFIKVDGVVYERALGNTYQEIVSIDSNLSQYNADGAVKDVSGQGVEIDLNAIRAQLLGEKSVVSSSTLLNMETKSPSSLLEIKSNDSVRDILGKISSGQDAKLAKMSETLLEIFKDKTLNTQLNVISDASLPFAGNNKGNVMTINIAKGGNNLSETFIHEFIHNVTVGHLSNYFNADWKTFKKGVEVPAEVAQANVLFNEFKSQIETRAIQNEQFGKEFDAFKEKFEKYSKLRKGESNTPVSFTSRELSLFYPTVNIKEFLAVSLSNNNDFLAEAAKMPYKKTKLNLQEKFISVLNELLNMISGVENNLAEEILRTNLNVVNKLNSAKPIAQTVSGKDLNKAINLVKIKPNISTNTEGDRLPSIKNC